LDKFIFLNLLGCFSAAGMGLWHGVEHWEMNKINVDSQTELFVKAWPDVSQFYPSFFEKLRNM
jgi:hypothetical protein